MIEDASQSTPDPAVVVSQQQHDHNDDTRTDHHNDDILWLSSRDHGGYDVVLCGTGLVQSILASALARAGCRVLHVDGNDQYGELETVWTLPYLLSRRHSTTTPISSTTTANPPARGVGAQQQQPPHESAGCFWHREFRTDTLEDEEDDDDEEPAENDGPGRAEGRPTTKTLRLHREGMLHSLRFHSIQRTASFPVTLHSFVQTAYGRGRVETLEPRNDGSAYHRLVIQLLSQRRQPPQSSNKNDQNTAAASLHPKLYVGIPNSKIYTSSDNNTIDEAYLYQHHQIRTVAAEIAARVLDSHSMSRQWALDVTPSLLFCVGPAVSGLLTSGVADYCEFKSLEGILYLQSQSQQSQTEFVFNRVPCSKNDVFASPLLTPMDKRRLMKFLQTALDYATAEHLAHNADTIEVAATTVATTTTEPSSSLQSWNERHLLQGRSLSRPQNKAVATNDLRHLQELCHNGNNNMSSFEEYLLQVQKLSPCLTALVRHALALEPSDDGTTTITVADGMKRLCAHLVALGRFGTTAFLVPLYGSGELSQAFCRSAAVYGATYLLRRAPTAIVLSCMDGDASPGAASRTSTTRAVQGIVLHGPHPDGEPLLETTSDSTTRGCDSSSTNNNNHTGTGRTQQIPCCHVVVPQGALRGRRQQTRTQRPSSGQRVLRRISILCGKPWITDDDTNDNGLQQRRHLLIIPPHVLGPEQNSTIHGLLLDEGVHVAPHVVPDGCSVLHWTMTIRAPDDGNENDENANKNYYAMGERILKDALQAVLQQHRRRQEQWKATSGAGRPSVPVQEIFHVTLSYDVDAPQSKEDPAPLHAAGLHVIHRPRPGVAADDAFDVAASIFAQICPDHEFLRMSPSVDEKVKEALGDLADEVDEENLVLKSAVGIMTQTTASPSKGGEEDAGVNRPASANESQAAELTESRK